MSAAYHATGAPLPQFARAEQEGLNVRIIDSEGNVYRIRMEPSLGTFVCRALNAHTGLVLSLRRQLIQARAGLAAAGEA